MVASRSLGRRQRCSLEGPVGQEISPGEDAWKGVGDAELFDGLSKLVGSRMVKDGSQDGPELLAKMSTVAHIL